MSVHVALLIEPPAAQRTGVWFFATVRHQMPLYTAVVSEQFAANVALFLAIGQHNQFVQICQFAVVWVFVVVVVVVSVFLPGAVGAAQLASWFFLHVGQIRLATTKQTTILNVTMGLSWVGTDFGQSLLITGHRVYRIGINETFNVFCV